MSEVYASNQVVPVSELTPLPTTVPYESKCKKIMLEGIGWAGSILVLCPYVVNL